MQNYDHESLRKAFCPVVGNVSAIIDRINPKKKTAAQTMPHQPSAVCQYDPKKSVVDLHNFIVNSQRNQPIKSNATA